MLLRYREVPPPPEMTGVVSNFWEFEAGAEMASPFAHRIPLDGCVSIAFCRPGHGPERVVMVGPRVELLEVPIYPGDRFWGLRLLPGASRSAIGVPGSALANYAGLLTTSLGTTVAREVAQAASLEEAIHRFGGLLGTAPVEPLVASAVSRIVTSGGEARIADVAREIGISDRQLLRVFKTEVGLSPKQFSRICRARAAALSALETSQSWGQIAAEHGYADQAHLSHDFRKMFGRTPSEFESDLLARIEHVDVTRVGFFQGSPSGERL